MTTKPAMDAIRLSPEDDVATVLRAVARGETIRVGSGAEVATIEAIENVPLCHKIALVPMAAGDRFYIELQRHGMAEERQTEPGLVEIAYDLDIPLVASNEAYFPQPEDFAAHDALSMADFKDLTELSRKFAVPLLEWFDRRGITQRLGDNRRAGPQLRAG
mgnify:CR=1 FL=1